MAAEAMAVGATVIRVRLGLRRGPDLRSAQRECSSVGGPGAGDERRPQQVRAVNRGTAPTCCAHFSLSVSSAPTELPSLMSTIWTSPSFPSEVASPLMAALAVPDSLPKMASTRTGSLAPPPPTSL